MIYKYTIPLPPVTKKNSQRILVNRKTGMPFIAPSSAYKRYEEQAIYFLAPKPKNPLAGRCRVVTVFYMKTRRKCDVCYGRTMGKLHQERRIKNDRNAIRPMRALPGTPHAMS